MSFSSSPVDATGYSGPCDNGTTRNYSDYAARGAGLGGSGTDYVGVYSEAWVRNLSPCTGTNLAQLTSVLPANLQWSGCSVCIVQIGYGVCTAPSGPSCNGIPNDGRPHFIWTCWDNDPTGCLADGWFGSAPVVGHRYAFQIVYQPYNWHFLLRDITANGPTKEKLLTIVHWHLADGVWWGAENWDANATLGPAATGGSAYDMPLEYLRQSTPWTIAQLD